MSHDTLSPHPPPCGLGYLRYPLAPREPPRIHKPMDPGPRISHGDVTIPVAQKPLQDTDIAPVFSIEVFEPKAFTINLI
jgi:hypothetical protein